MGTFLFAHRGVPFLVGLALVFFVAAADREPISWSSCNDIAVDFGILSMGANGGIFLNPLLAQHWGTDTPVYGIGVVVANFVLTSFLVYRRRWRTLPVGWLGGGFDLFLGALALTITCWAFASGYGKA
jgi:hypothetical protein